MCDNNRDPFIVTLNNVLLPPDLCNRLFSIITFINLVYICILHKIICTVYSGAKEKNEITLPYSPQRKHVFLGEIKEISKTKKSPYRRKIAL